MPTSGSRRFRSTSTARALSGEMYTMRVIGFFGAGENMIRSIAARNAASVFPEPVGARTSAFSPRAIAGQASSCARVDLWNVASNHARAAGLKVASGSLPTSRDYRSAGGDRAWYRHTIRAGRGRSPRTRARSRHAAVPKPLDSDRKYARAIRYLRHLERVERGRGQDRGPPALGVGGGRVRVCVT